MQEIISMTIYKLLFNLFDNWEKVTWLVPVSSKMWGNRQSVLKLIKLYMYKGSGEIVNVRLCQKGRSVFFFASPRHFKVFSMQAPDVQVLRHLEVTHRKNPSNWYLQMFFALQNIETKWPWNLMEILPRNICHPFIKSCFKDLFHIYSQPSIKCLATYIC